MKAKKHLLLSTNSFLTHPAILRYCFQGKTLLSLPIEMTEWKNLPINLVWGRELLTKHQYLIYSYFMKQKSRIFSLNFPQMWWRFYIPATLLTCLLFWELLSLKDISNEVTKKRSREFKTLTYTLLPGNKKYTVRICCSCAETACLFCTNATEDLNVTQDLKNYSYCFAVGHLHQPILSAKHHKAADFCPSFYLLLRKHQGKKKTKCI